MGNKKRFKKSILAAVLMCLVTVSISGCGKTATTQKQNEGVTLTYWMPLSSSAATTVSDYGETPFAKELEKRLGVKIKYQHPPQGQAQEKFNILIAANELPDIMYYTWVDYPGGPSNAITDKKIIDLSKDMKTKAPDFYKYVSEHPEMEKLMKTDDGQIYAFPFIRGDKMLQFSQGLVLRKDWLDELNLAVPETIDEWEKVLIAFKEKKKATPLYISPVTFTAGAFVGAYGINQSYYVENGKVKYGPLEPGFKDFIVKMNDWYNKGLIDREFASYDSKAVDAKLLNDQLGATTGSIGSGIGRWLASAKTPGFDLVAAPHPVLKKGDEIKFSPLQLPVVNSGAAITTNCKNVDAAYKVLNYGYSDEGRMFFNFGIEGQSYTMVEGYPKYTQQITKNPDGLSMTASLARYAQSCDVGPFVQDKRYMEQYGSLPQQQNALKVWTNPDAEKYAMPYVFFNVQDASELIKKSTMISSYTDETILKMIMGVQKLDQFDAYIEGLKSRGIQEVLAARQGAYEKYLQR